MTDGIGRYRKVYPRIWRDPSFVGLSEGERLVALYLISGPQMNRIGLTHFSIFTAAEDLGTTPDTFAKRLSKVCATFGWFYDRRARVLYIPSWFTFNRPENENVLKGILNDLGDVPASPLAEEFARKNLGTLPQTLHHTFAERCRQRIAKPSPIQEPDQDLEHEHKQKPAPLRGSLVNEKASIAGQPKPQHLTLARLTLKTTNPNGPIEDLIDTFGWLARNENPQVNYVRAEAVAALTLALSERRTSVA
jgi:hypothetical protein